MTTSLDNPQVEDAATGPNEGQHPDPNDNSTTILPTVGGTDIAPAETPSLKTTSSRSTSPKPVGKAAEESRTDGPYRLLSELLHDIPPEELCLVLEHYEDAVIKGVVKALPAPAHQVFPIELVTGQGKRLTRKIDEEIVMPDAAFHTWLANERKASRLAVLAVTGRVETSLDKLASGDDDFQKLLEIRRRRLQKSKPVKSAK